MKEQPKLLCPCGITMDGDVHRPGCAVYLSDPRVAGNLICSDCGGKLSSLRDNRCGVCDYWQGKRST